jgi:type IV pilus assembly protein PilC
LSPGLNKDLCMTSSSLLYRWHGTDANGTPVSGQTPGRSPAYVRAGLIRQGITVASLRPEARLKLDRIRPGTVGQASRISGVTPADLSLVMVWLKRDREGSDRD